MINCILTGVGGQGTVLASKLIARCAMEKGLSARTAETIGMAQRGGCVVSHVRIGGEIHSPMIPLSSADLILGFEPAEAVRALIYLKPGGAVVVSEKAIQPVTASLANTGYRAAEMLHCLKERAGLLIPVDTEQICALCGSAKVVNVALLGAAAAAGTLGISVQEMERAIQKSLPPKYIEINIKALYAGAAATKGEAAT